jgi:hypothetical protein
MAPGRHGRVHPQLVATEALEALADLRRVQPALELDVQPVRQRLGLLTPGGRCRLGIWRRYRHRWL